MTAKRKHPRPELLSAFIDGELDGTAAREIQAHLASCGQCHALVDDLRAIRSAAIALREGPAIESHWSQVAERLTAVRDAPPPGFPWAALAAAALLLLWIGIAWEAMLDRPIRLPFALGSSADLSAGNLAVSLLALGSAVLVVALWPRTTQQVTRGQGSGEVVSAQMNKLRQQP